MSHLANVIAVEGLSHSDGRRLALEGVTLTVPTGALVGLIGPDGVGKSTLLSLVAGAKRIQTGRVEVFGRDMADQLHRSAVCPRIAFLPQGLGKNLYPDLSVRENIDFFGRLFGEPAGERARRIDALLEATGLAPFPDRPARKLSGGMRQKLGLCCALVHDPDLLILDEPTTGVDPLSRRQFWELIERMRARRAGMSVVVATAYMEEAERFDELIAMNAGRILASATPAELKRLTGQGSLEESFIALLPEAVRAGRRALSIPPRPSGEHEAVIVARGLTRRFGEFVAVDDVSFAIERGEIFGFLGSNGCGKTTTMKMLTGLLPASDGSAWLLGQPIDATNMRLRRRVGYMSQSFSLYTELTVRQNLDLHARLFHIAADRAKSRIAALIERFGFGPYVDQRASELPLGIRQRLSLAVAVVHEPEVLILDEPTSGVDPLARDSFWELLVELSRRQGVTIFVSTHFMNEAARCDRVALMHGGRVVAAGTPTELAEAKGAADLEDAFVAYLQSAGGEGSSSVSGPPEPERAATSSSARVAPRAGFSLGRLFAYSWREALELWRDPVRLGFALLGTAFLMIVFGLGINTDVNQVTFAVLDRDNTPESRAYLQEFRGSPYFAERKTLANYDDLDRALRSAAFALAIEVPPGFGRDLRRGSAPEIGAWVDGAMPFRAETVRGYLAGLHQQYVADVAGAAGSRPASPVIETRFVYNQDFKSIFAMVPGTIAMLLAFMPAMLMAVGVVREKELGSIVNLYVTPVTRLEFLLGKQLPYVILCLISFLTLFLMAVLLFGVTLKGSFWVLLLGALLYVTAMTGYGLVISAFTRTQIAALFVAGIMTSLPAVQFSGMLAPVSSLVGFPAFMAHTFPAMYFLRISVGTFTKALGFQELAGSLLALAVFIPILILISLAFLRRQEA
ncbi:ribosome-associated ATPase/putative transporter RbbA [Mesorhizobium sp. WSM4906]|uniref:ribosome-associated ATPase/putative transporter RbbA n=1 Tax=Mesorhizobium sp. WSM4906 TaxID=3038546 RepID=UPI002416D01E|nr:ribosome-associated ATPase/putative transporter RbbA [Mesorhizobium sp. WSM4906]WFP79067.1 ribosome-associated ATPase/putative transporter RbbA [Mesorhizobium sp. WSM4906]